MYGLVCAAIIGNLCNFNAFFGVDFILGSIFTLIIIAVFGIKAGVVGAFIAGCFTVIQWEHFYAVPILTLEALFVGIVIARNRKLPIIIADMLFWLTVGLPVAYICCRYGLKMTSGVLNLLVFKHALNGLFNASVASIMIFAVQAYYGGKPVLNLKNPSIRHIIFSGITFILLGSCLLVVGIESHRGEDIKTRQMADNLNKYSNQIKNYLTVWHSDSIESINEAAQKISAGIAENPSKWLDESGSLKSAYTNPDIQLIVESFRQGKLGFDSVYVGNSDGISVAFYPVVTRQNQTNIGIDYSDRDYFTQVKENLRPVVSEVFVSRRSPSDQIVAIITPIIYQKKFVGYISAAYNLSTMAKHLKVLQVDESYNINVFDANSKVVLSSLPSNEAAGFNKMSGFAVHQVLRGGVQHFMPKVGSSPVMRYKDSLFLSRQPAGFSGWEIVAVYPAAVIQSELVHFVSIAMMVIYFILLMGCPLTLLLSNMITSPLTALTQMKDILKTVKTTRNIEDVEWPDSFIAEISELSCELKEMVRESLLERDVPNKDKISQ